MEHQCQEFLRRESSCTILIKAQDQIRADGFSTLNNKPPPRPKPITINQMRGVIIHPGLPRTGTTVLQQHVFPRAERFLVLSKVNGKTSTLTSLTLGNLRNLIKSLEEDIRSGEVPAPIRHLVFSAVFTACYALAVDAKRSDVQRVLQELLILVCAGPDEENVLVSSERLVDTYSSLNGSSKQKGEKIFPIYTLINNLRAIGIRPKIVVCMRDPLAYLRSKYLRTLGQRHAIGALPLSPFQFIAKQVALEENHPGTSALAPAQHSRFLQTLQADSTVHAVGFRELICSKDVFSELGFIGQSRHAFQDFPRENQLPYSRDEENYVEKEIVRALKSRNYFDQIESNKRFD